MNIDQAIEMARHETSLVITDEKMECHNRNEWSDSDLRTLFFRVMMKVMNESNVTTYGVLGWNAKTHRIEHLIEPMIAVRDYIYGNRNVIDLVPMLSKHVLLMTNSQALRYHVMKDINPDDSAIIKDRMNLLVHQLTKNDRLVSARYDRSYIHSVVKATVLGAIIYPRDLYGKTAKIHLSKCYGVYKYSKQVTQYNAQAVISMEASNDSFMKLEGVLLRKHLDIISGEVLTPSDLFRQAVECWQYKKDEEDARQNKQR